jgi:hypothetical protein
MRKTSIREPSYDIGLFRESKQQTESLSTSLGNHSVSPPGKVCQANRISAKKQHMFMY